MSTFKLKIEIQQGATLNKVVTWKAGAPPTPVDLTGCTARTHFRESVDSPNVLLELSTANGGMELGGTAGTIAYRMPFAATAALAWTSAVYDTEILFPDGTKLRKIKGTATVSKEITRD